MKLKNIKVKYLIPNLILAFAYPIIKAFTSEKHLLAFSDGCTYIGLAFLITGIVNSFFLHGDLDITGYVAERAITGEKEDFEQYMTKKKEKRKESFNYSLFSALILFLIAFITSLFC